MWIKRFYESDDILLTKGKVNLLYGARRAGKTELIKRVIKKLNVNTYFGEGDDLELRRLLSSTEKSRILSAFQDYDCIVIDEAQRITNIGLALKILVDNFKDKIIIASGSSSFRLSSQVGAPLTGRSNTNMLFPLSVMEIKAQYGGMDVLHRLHAYMIYGMYPEALLSKSLREKENYLKELRNAYLLQDILELDNVRNADKLFDLLRLLAFQIGQEVSLSELGNALGLAKQTITRYLDLFEKAFIIKKLNGFSKNLRKEVTKTSRYYFFDNGIRNALINNFNVLESRNDVGMLWENFMVMERLKWQEYNNFICNNYFWRTYDQKEVDWVEEYNGKLSGYEFKWNPQKKKTQKEWLETYQNADFKIISTDNFLDFVS
ncbi:MAG: ATP-binding protein [Bacteroidota bacterium]|nr:ATP-binding protein [Bacteroidota bacterium]